MVNFHFMKRWKRVQHTRLSIYINFLPHNYRRVPKIQVCVTLKLSSTLDFYPIHMCACVILFCYLILPKGKLCFYVYFSPYFRYSALKTSFVYIYIHTQNYNREGNSHRFPRWANQIFPFRRCLWFGFLISISLKVPILVIVTQ